MLSTLVPVEEAEVIIVLGGDGFMLESVHRFQGGHLVYGRNRGTIGFLMNEFKEDTLVERINAARPQRLFPLQMTVTDSKEERIMRKKILSLFILIALAAPTTISLAEEKGGGGAAEMARKLQDPLANIKAVMTDNTIGFNTGDDDGTSYGFQFQPVYAIDVPDKGFTFLPRAVIPITGL
ncbi:MAG: hypothetical protein KAS94_06915, partial [Desulfobulbaceae bacterium]|nr:hypothetical protein [Desulfobulbaceae bacterium]